MTAGRRSFARRRAASARILFYADDTVGLGHIRRMLAIAGELARRRPDVALLALTGSLQAHAYELPPNFDFVKLPTADKSWVYRFNSPARKRPGQPPNIWKLRATLIEATAKAFHPHMVVVDSAPTGAQSELATALAWLRAAEPRVELVLGLRDIVAAPEHVRARWTDLGGYDLIDRIYDRILVYGDRDVYDPIAEYGLPPNVAVKTVFCGYIQRAEPVLPATDVREHLGVRTGPLVIVATGGGQDGGELLRAYLAAARAGKLPDVMSLLVTGPRIGREELTVLEADASAIPGVMLVPFVSDFVSYLNAADVIVSKGGYNTLCEAISLGKRPVVVPRIWFGQEQLVRAERFAALGLVRLIHPNNLTPERLVDAVQAELSAESSPPSVLDFDGLRRAGDVLLDALAHVSAGH